MSENKLFNNKGFTTVEIVVSFALVVVILASMTTLVINYRDKVNDEIVISQLIDFKNTITKIVYDDIVDGIYTSVSSCEGNDECVKFIGNGEENTLEVKKENGSNGISKGLYFEYKGIKYFLPDSDLNDFNTGEYMIDVYDFVISRDTANNIYSVKIPIHHNGMDKDYVINLLVNHHEID